MQAKFANLTALAILLICQFTPCLAVESSDPNHTTKYLDAVRTFADNVLKYGRDTYGPKHTPLFVDGLNIHTHEPVKWIDPDGTRWILSNFASQQTLLRTLDGLSTLTGDPKYREAAMRAIEYALKHLQTSNGLIYWGQSAAYDASADKVWGENHVFKLHYPYYELMWKVDPKETKRFIEAYWSAHVNDWSNLDFNRIALFDQRFEEPWNHEYDEDSPTFFRSKHGGGGFLLTGASLVHAGTTLHRLTGEEPPLIWSEQLIRRFVDTRHQMTGIGSLLYNNPDSHRWLQLEEDMKEHYTDPLTTIFPFNPFEFRYLQYPQDTGAVLEAFPWMSIFLVGNMLGEEGRKFTQWSLGEFTAWGKVSYRKKDNSFVPILTDGTKLEGYVWKKRPSGLNVAKPYPADPSFFWVYSVAYRITGDEFMWEMVRNIALGNDFGHIGETPAHNPELRTNTVCFDVYSLLGFLELYAKTKNLGYLEMARSISDNILSNQFHKGFFVPSARHIYTRFDCFEPLALLHLEAAMKSKIGSVPRVWPSVPIFVPPYRHKEQGVDLRVIYALTESTEPPMSLQEAAAIGDVDLVRSLIEKGTDVDSVDNSFLKTALERAAMNGHKEVVALLIAKGAKIEAWRGWPGGTALDYAAEKGHKEIVEMLIARGADVNAKRAGYPAGDTPLHSATRAGHKEIVELLVAKGANVNVKNSEDQTPLDIATIRNRRDIMELLIAKGADVSLHSAARQGLLEKIRELIGKGSDINSTDFSGQTALHYAARRGHNEIVELLLANGANVNTKDNKGLTPAEIAMTRQRTQIAKLLVDNNADISSIHLAAFTGELSKVKTFIYEGIDVNTSDTGGCTALHYAAAVDVAEFLIANGTTIHPEDKDGETPLHTTAAAGFKDVVELLIKKGADVNFTPKDDYPPLHYALWKENVESVKLLVNHGAMFNVKDLDGWTAFRYVVSGGNIELLKFFIAKGAKTSDFHMAAWLGDLSQVNRFVEQGTGVNTKDDHFQWTPLHWTAFTGSKHVAEFLLAKGASINIKDEFNAIPLHYATINGHQELVELLLANGSKFNTKDNFGKTPLHYAASQGHLEIVKLLIAKGANINAETDKGKTTISLAKEKGHTEIVELLKKHTANLASITTRPKSVLLSPSGESGMDEVCDLILDSPVPGKQNFGWDPACGDVNGDGYDDVVATAAAWDNGARRGRVYLYYGGQNMDAVPDKIFTGEAKGDYFGDGCGVGDVNGDGYDDVLVGAPCFSGGAGDGRVYVFHGGPDMDEKADLILEGESGTGGYYGIDIGVGDLNKDGYDDVVVTAVKMNSWKGRAYLYYGGDPMDSTCDLIFEGENENDAFGRTVFLGDGDVNGDHYPDLLIQAKQYPSGKNRGRIYLYYGGDPMDNICDKTFTGENDHDEFGEGNCLIDADNDGFCDVIIGADCWPARKKIQGRIYLYWGSKNMDVNADKTFTGELGAALSIVYGGYFNDDEYGDILTGAWGYKRFDLRGQAHIYHGDIKNEMDAVADYTFNNDIPNSRFGMRLTSGDVNGDGYDDAIINGFGYNNQQGRIWLYHGGPDE